jgi:hypothetical protein
MQPGLHENFQNISPDNTTPAHPLHVTVTEINHNATDKTLEISCRIFTDDFEKVLAQNYKTKIDLVNPPDRAAMENLVKDFVQRHVLLKGDNKDLRMSYLGYERDNDAIYSYLEVGNIPTIKKIEVKNTLLQEMFTDQINLVHITVNGKRKSAKLDYPEKDISFTF